KMSTRAGTANLCIPYNVIEPVMSDLSAQSWFSAGKLRGADEYKGRIISKLGKAPLEVSAVLTETTVTLADLLNLSEGDLLMTDTPASEPMTLYVEGEKKFLVNVGQLKGM